jgi:FkbM family methyltransferase
MISYAQNLEDVLLARVFEGKSDGVYVDVGAHDPEYLSVTKHFYDIGWHGVNVEPLDANFARFVEQRPRDINVQAAVTADTEGGYIDMLVPADSAFATIYENIAARLPAETTVQRLRVPVRTLSGILDEYDVEDIDFLVVDVEGAEREVLESVDLTRFRPAVIMCEATLPGSSCDFDRPSSIFTHEEWEHLLLGADYAPVYFDSLNRYYLRSESAHLLPRFSFPVSPVRDQFERVEDVRRLEHLRSQLEQLRGEAELLKTEAEEQRSATELLAARLRESEDAVAAQLARIVDLERGYEGLRYAIWARDGVVMGRSSRRSPLQRALQRLNQDTSILG